MEKVGFSKRPGLHTRATASGIKLDEQPVAAGPGHASGKAPGRDAVGAGEVHQRNCSKMPDRGGGPWRTSASRKLSGKHGPRLRHGVRARSTGELAGQRGSLRPTASRSKTSPRWKLDSIATRDENKRGHYHRFRDRVMFPIRDVRRSRPIALRRADHARTRRSPPARRSITTRADTPLLFYKSDLLYGIDLARHAGATEGYLAVVEGLHGRDDGAPVRRAAGGRHDGHGAERPKHVSQLRRYVPKVVLVYDADAGGFSGVDRALEIFVSQDVEVVRRHAARGPGPV